MDEYGMIGAHSKAFLFTKTRQLVTPGPPEGFSQDQIQTKQRWIGRSRWSCRWESTVKIVREFDPLVPYRSGGIIYTIVKITTYRHALHGSDITITCRCRMDVNKVQYFPGDIRHQPGSFQDSGTSGIIVPPQSSTKTFSWSSTAEASGLPRGFWAYCTVHVATNNPHSGSENPDEGLSG